MLNKTNINLDKNKLIVYFALVVITFAVFWQVNQYDFAFDDDVYVTQNSHIQSGITLNGLRWVFSTRYFYLWTPLVWLSFIINYQLYGLNAGGYHLTNLILHVLSTLLLFWLFNRMTKEIWKSAFIAALFAIHPLHVESVAWISERKDVLSAFFWMMTLCLYVYYTEKPIIKRYLPVLFSFICALMSKPMAVTLPVIMILLDYWPLKRFQSKKDNFILWQLREKLLFFILSTIVVIITFYPQQDTSLNTLYSSNFQDEIPLIFRMANAPIASVTYLVKTFFPYDMTIYYPFSAPIQAWQVIITSLLIIVITIIAAVRMKRHPYLFTGWIWYVITIFPVIGIIQIAGHSMADRYTYIPLIGIFVILAWGIPSLINSAKTKKKMLFTASIAALIILAVLAWKQCSYWKNNADLWNHALNVTKNNYVAHNNIAAALFKEGKTKEAIYHCNQAISIAPNYVKPYINKGLIYSKLGQYNVAVENFNEAINRKTDYAEAYLGRGHAYERSGQYQRAIEDYNGAIRLNHYNANAYNDRGITYGELGQYQPAIGDFNEAIHLNPDNIDAYNNRGFTYAKLGQYQRAIEDFNKAIRLRPDFLLAFYNRGNVYDKLGQHRLADEDWNQATKLSRKKYMH